MIRFVAFVPLALLLCIAIAGCEPPAQNAGVTNAPPGPPAPPKPPGSETATDTTSPTTTATSTEPAAASNKPPLPLETKAGVFAGSLDDLAAPASPAQPSPGGEPNTERVKAQKGVGIKGRSLDEYEGVVVTPVKSYFSTKERIVFEIAVPQAMNLFQATEGRFPESHDEFMEKIVKFNNIQLPELPMGHKYVYDPETHELLVERPKRKTE
jgi:hypothetical protein